MEKAIPINRKAVSVAVAAQMVGLSERHVYALIHAGDFPAKKVGSRWLVPIAALDRWLEEGLEEQRGA